MNQTITITAYLLATVFLILLVRAVVKAAKNRQRIKKQLKRSEEFKANAKKLKSQGLKEFSFANGKVKIFAKSYKEANAQYQTSRNGNNLQ